MDKEIIKKDFDKIAKLEESKWNHNHHYHEYLLRHLPPGCKTVLDIGCGSGEFTRALAGRADEVVGIDFSTEMISKARSLSREYKNITYINGDVLEYNFTGNKFDSIVSIATVHHLPLKWVLETSRNVLNTGGTLIILDLYKQVSIPEFLLSGLAIPFNLLFMLTKRGSIRVSEEERKAWEEHGKHEDYMSIEEIRNTCKEIMPDAVVKRHLFWRYSLIWKNGERKV
ncbi:MAG: class I SAM-dependent methyltransferase [Clostridia bacterium]|nr:class I SAM-dependent methyltransferase [Clostridia bacterium]